MLNHFLCEFLCYNVALKGSPFGTNWCILIMMNICGSPFGDNDETFSLWPMLQMLMWTFIVFLQYNQ